MQPKDDWLEVEARLTAYQNLKKWGNLCPTYEYLQRLLGHDGHIIHWIMTDREVEICQMLNGPHGYALFKMLEARLK